MLCRRFLCFTSLLAFVSVQAHAQWTVVNLTPAGAGFTVAYGVHGWQQVGQVGVAGGYNASLWSGTAAWVNLNPAGSLQSRAFGVNGGQQVGYAAVAGFDHAGLWSGTAASWVDLNPAGSTNSKALGISGTSQVGYATVGVVSRASVWSGTAASWVDLSGGLWSEARGVDGGQQVGVLQVGGNDHASLWTGTAASWVDLHPASATESQADGVYGGQQVGLARIGSEQHASLWTGTSASWVDLHPGWAGAVASWALAVHGGQQVGGAYMGSDALNRASLWSGTADSWVDLHAFLPPGFGNSTARSIWHEGDFTYVVGSAYNWTTLRIEALMWVASNNFGPTGYSPFRGVWVSGGLPELIGSDDQRLVFRNGLTLSPQESPITARFDTVSPFVTVNSLKFKVEALVSTPGLQQGIDLFDYTTNNWVTVDARNASVSNDAIVTVPITDPNRFIQAGTRAMRAQIRYRRTGLTLTSTWFAQFDQVRWELTP